jgi:hypothetical protein
MASNTAQLADRLVIKRARVAQTLGGIFVVLQATSVHDDHVLNRPQELHLVAWFVWAIILLLFLATGGGFLRNRRVRSLMNDESTRDHRLRAMAFGFWIAVGCALFLYGLSFLSSMTVGEATRLIITSSIGFALLYFGWLEKKALREADG